MKDEHRCEEYHGDCCCYLLADEPADDCPVHGDGGWPPRCKCGKFVKRPERYGPWLPEDEEQLTA